MLLYIFKGFDFQIFSCHDAVLCFGLVTNNTSSGLGKHHGLVWNTCLGDGDHGLRCSDFQRQTAGFGRHEKIHLLLMQASSQIPAGVTWTVIGGLVGFDNATSVPSTLLVWKPANELFTWTWYATFGTNVNVGLICGLQKHLLLTLYCGDWAGISPSDLDSWRQGWQRQVTWRVRWARGRRSGF